ncbi:MAG: transcription termination factor NusA [Candidatus Dojkabacteria bacterium]|uniref:Transcription termination/antitermination protein NusA n=2 Tax=Candidatus Dojkabacteria TaxID=74243 RepID=A0A136KKU5_9BACT|nr:MAG: hypothetical protein UZ20_WS6002000115 [candidate division WS6 bacterium OLB21]MBW7953568.1 transcription termination/antitermination protein NusA [Candidatus Dojkabacteria bacterium]WKZ27844.1 MAG: transcription termination factor NusA [Candidatus Dojkabacteria bacterium]
MSSQTDFLSAINQIAAERNIDPDEVLEAIKQAVKTGFRRDYPEEEEGSVLEVEIDPTMGAIRVFADKKVVDKVTSPATQISLSDAKKLEKKLSIGDHLLVDITPSGDFGRVAAQAAKQVILQKIREAEKEAVMVEFKDKIGEIDYGVVQRMDGENVIFEIRRAIALMPIDDRIPSEFYRSGSRLKVLLKEISTGPRGKQLIVSRAAPEFLVGLFKIEVPEILSGSVEIKAIAREAGSRSKVAVVSNSDGVDPIGSCVGQKGVRINAIMNELKFGPVEEKIDIILWDEDIQHFIANALSPAQVISVEITDSQNHEAKVIVPDDQLSLAIGKEGQNVRLAARLTGWNIDIQGETLKANDQEQHGKIDSENTAENADSLSSLKLSTRILKVLEKAGITSVSQLKESIEQEKAIAGVGEKSLEEIKAALS